MSHDKGLGYARSSCPDRLRRSESCRRPLQTSPVLLRFGNGETPFEVPCLIQNCQPTCFFTGSHQFLFSLYHLLATAQTATSANKELPQKLSERKRKREEGFTKHFNLDLHSNDASRFERPCVSAYSDVIFCIRNWALPRKTPLVSTRRCPACGSTAHGLQNGLTPQPGQGGKSNA